MAVPTPDFTYLDLPSDGFTANGTPAVADDRVTVGGTYEGDDIDDYLSHTDTPISTGSSKASISCWVYVNDTGVNRLLNQRPTSSFVAGHYIGLNAGAITWQLSTNGNTNYIYSQSNGGQYVAKTWFHLLVTGDLGTKDLNIYVNGSEVTYAINSSDASSASSLGTMPALGVYSLVNDAFSGGFSGRIARIKVWDDVVVTSAQASEEYTNESNAIVDNLNLGLVRYYDLNETSGTTITDQGSDGSNITLTGTTAATITGTGQVGTGLTPDGVNDAMTNGALSLVDVGMTNDLSFSLWYKNVTPASGDILVMAALSDNDNGFKIRYESAAYITLSFEIAGTFSGKRIANNAWTADGTWHNIIATYDASAGTVTTYFDGVASDAGGNGGGLGGASVTGLSLGCNPNSGENANVGLDEFCIWERVLSATEIDLTYDLGAAGVEITGTLPAASNTGLRPRILLTHFS